MNRVWAFLLILNLSLASTAFAVGKDFLACGGLFASPSEASARLLEAYSRLLSQYRERAQPGAFEVMLAEALRNDSSYFAFPGDDSSTRPLAEYIARIEGAAEASIGGANSPERREFDSKIKNEIRKRLDELTGIRTATEILTEAKAEVPSPFLVLAQHGTAETLSADADLRYSVNTPEKDVIAVTDLVSRKEVLRFRHPDVNRFEVSSDFKKLASISSDGTFVVWDLATGRKLREFIRDAGTFPFKMNSDFTRAVVYSENAVRVLDLERGNVLRTIPGKFKRGEIQVDPDFRRIIVLVGPGKNVLYDLTNGKRLLDFPNCYVSVPTSFVAMRAVTITDRVATVWSLEDGRVLGTMAADQPRISQDGRRAVLNVGDLRHYEVWDLDRMERIHAFDPGFDVSHFELSPDGKRVVLYENANYDQKIDLYDIEAGVALPLNRNPGFGFSTEFSADSSKVIFRHDGLFYQVFDVRTGAQVSAWKTPLETRFSFISPDRRRGLNFSDGKHAKFWDLDRGEVY